MTFLHYGLFLPSCLYPVRLSDPVHSFSTTSQESVPFFSFPMSPFTLSFTFPDPQGMKIASQLAFHSFLPLPQQMTRNPITSWGCCQVEAFLKSEGSPPKHCSDCGTALPGKLQQFSNIQGAINPSHCNRLTALTPITLHHIHFLTNILAQMVGIYSSYFDLGEQQLFNR